MDIDGANKKQTESLGRRYLRKEGEKCHIFRESRRLYACSGLNMRSEETQEDPKFSSPADPQALNMQEVKN